MTNPQPAPSYREAVRPIVPKLIELTAEVLFADIWQRPALSERDRSLITVSVLTALYRTGELDLHIGRALDNGLTPEEIGEAIPHVAFYGGWPTAVAASLPAKEVFEARGGGPTVTGGG